MMCCRCCRPECSRSRLPAAAVSADGVRSDRPSRTGVAVRSHAAGSWRARSADRCSRVDQCVSRAAAGTDRDVCRPGGGARQPCLPFRRRAGFGLCDARAAGASNPSAGVPARRIVRRWFPRVAEACGCLRPAEIVRASTVPVAVQARSRVDSIRGREAKAQRIDG